MNKRYFVLFLSLSLGIAGTGVIFGQGGIGCPGCTVSSNPSENWGFCTECEVEGGDICTSIGPGPSCDGNQD